MLLGILIGLAIAALLFNCYLFLDARETERRAERLERR
jgi:hypothetical protein